MFNTFPLFLLKISHLGKLNVYKGGDIVARVQKEPSKNGVSAASVKGNAGPQKEMNGGGKKTSQNQQYKKENMGSDGF